MLELNFDSAPTAAFASIDASRFQPIGPPTTGLGCRCSDIRTKSRDKFRSDSGVTLRGITALILANLVTLG